MGVIAVVPARGGSQGLPRKNLAMVGGVTLVERALHAGRDSTVVDRVVLTTDDPEIASTGGGLAEVVMRPADLARDDVASSEVAIHALDEAGAIDNDVIVLLQPTSPLRRAEHITSCVRIYLSDPSGSVIAVTRPGHHPAKSFVRVGGELRPFVDWASIEAPRQSLPEVLQPNGAVYVVGAGDLRSARSFVLPPVRPYEMSALESVDIDDAADLALAEAIATTSDLRR